MILVDTSVWVDHLRRGDPALAELLQRSLVAMHPFVIGELACGNLRDRDSLLVLLQDLPKTVVADADEVLRFIEVHSLHGKGIGYIDIHLLASVALTDGSTLWTRDARLRRIAERMACAYSESSH